MIYYHDIGVETKDHFYQYHVFPVDTCGRRVSSPIAPLFGIDTSISQTILCEVEINTNYGKLEAEVRGLTIKILTQLHTIFESIYLNS